MKNFIFLKLFGKKSPKLPENLMVDYFEPPEPLQTAVLFLVFNKPDTTRKVFASIRKARPPRLYISADGSRVARDGEDEKVKQVREIVMNVDWPCDVKTNFSKGNMGCKYAVSSGITWFFEHEEQGIILEDDTLPNQSFFWFCEKMLSDYKDKKNVMHIGGYKPEYIGFDHYSISFTRATHVWGWATWRDRWKHYDVECDGLAKDLNCLVDYEYFALEKAVEKRLIILDKLCRNKIDTWDYQWNKCIRFEGGVAIRPAVNLVQNIGHGHIDATHTHAAVIVNPVFHLDIRTMRLPPWILPNRTFERQFELNL